jgi:RNA polymerase sigma factor (sigma-70 family)
MKGYLTKSALSGAPDCPKIFNEFYPLIRRAAGVRAAVVARTCGLSHDERDDLAQNAALEVWRKLSLFDAGRSSIRTFIERIISNEMAGAVRRLRTQKRQAPLFESTPYHADREAGYVTLRLDVQRVLNGLRPDQRDVCRMLAQYSPTEISRRTGISRTIIYRTIRDLRIAFADIGPPHRLSHTGGPRPVKSPKSSRGFPAAA